MSNIPQRTCMGCNTKKNKNELLRIVKTNQNEIIIDKTGRAQGRGAYICNNEECLNKVKRNKRLEKSLNTVLSEDIYNSIRGVIIDKQ